MNDKESQLDRHPRDRLKRSLSLNAAILLVVSSVIGSGIFFTPGPIAELLPDPGLIFLVWITGGLVSLAGALANAELGAMFPRAGGDYVYLREAYHPLAGFIVGWLSFFVIYVGTIATLATAFASSLAGFIALDDGGMLTLAAVIIIGVSTINYIGVRWGAVANNVTGYFKIFALLILGVAAPLFGEGEPSRLGTVFYNTSATSIWAFGAAMSPILFSYLGWNASIYVASEVHDPGRTIPRSLFLGLGICVIIYICINAVYIYALPMSELRGVDNAGVAAAQSLFGSLGGSLVGVFVLGSILGTINAMLLIGPRIAYAMAIDDLFFKGVDAAHKRYKTPHIAIIVQAFGAILLLLIIAAFPGNLFINVLSYTTFAIVLATMADVSALYALRRKKPDLHRPYRAWGYPWLPAVYLIANGGIAVSLLAEKTEECVIGLLITATALPFYYLFARKREVHKPERASEQRSLGLALTGYCGRRNNLWGEDNNNRN